MKRAFIITFLLMGCGTSIDWKTLVLSTIDIAAPIIREAVSSAIADMDASTVNDASNNRSIVDASLD